MFVAAEVGTYTSQWNFSVCPKDPERVFGKFPIANTSKEILPWTRA